MLKNEKYNCKKIIFSSSATVYGDQYDAPISEEVSPKPKYIWFHKIIIENLLFSTFSNRKDEWHITLLRYFNPVGNHFQENGWGSAWIPTNLFPVLCKVAAKS